MPTARLRQLRSAAAHLRFLLNRWGLACILMAMGLHWTVLAFVDQNSLPKRKALSLALSQLKAQHAQLAEKAYLLQARSAALSGRSEAQEQAIRQSLGWVRPTDVIIRFDE